MSKSGIVILILIWLFLVVTTPINPIIARNQYLTIPWYVVVMAFLLWVLWQLQEFTIRSKKKGA